VVEQQRCCDEKTPGEIADNVVERGQEVGQYGNAVNIYCASWNIVKRVLLVKQKGYIVKIYGVSENTVNYFLLSLLHS
jgi:hypothetical protein